jgi:hypothetical protein
MRLPCLCGNEFSLSAPNTLFQHRLRQLRAWNPGVVTFVFRKILKAAKLFDRQHILGGLAIQSFGIDIQSARRLLCGFPM